MRFLVREFEDYPDTNPDSDEEWQYLKYCHPQDTKYCHGNTDSNLYHQDDTLSHNVYHCDLLSIRFRHSAKSRNPNHRRDGFQSNSYA